MNAVTVLEARLEEALEALKKLAKKAERYGTPPITWTLSEVREDVREDRDGRKVRVLVRDIVFSSLEAPKVGNYTFIAKLELTPNGAIIDSIPGEVLPERFRHTKGECEHCQQNRFRKHLFVVRDHEGQLVQVGRSCLRDYMGMDTPASVSARFNFLREAADLGEEFGGSGIIENSALELLAVTTTAIRLWGWVPKSAPEWAGKPTAEKIAPWFWVSPSDTVGQAYRDALRAAITEADWKTAQAVLDWVASEEAGDSEYIHNLRVILAPGIVPMNRRGYACSAVAAYQRHLSKLEVQRRERETSRHLFAVGERIKDLRVTCMSNRSIHGTYGLTIIYKLQDDRGNVFSWFSSGGANLEVGRTYKVDATVKGHGEYNGVAETQLTRAKVKEVL
jgi:hypothetical protein